MDNGVVTSTAFGATRPGRLDSVQALRGLAAIAVVFFHAHQFELDPRYFGRPPMGGFWAWGMHGIDLFFVISGFVIAHVHAQDFRRGTAWRRFLAARISRIYLPYWPVLAVLALAYFAMPGLGRETGVAVRDPGIILRSATLWPGTKGLLSVAWTLEHEVVFYLVAMIALMRPAMGVLLFVAWQAYALLAGATGSDAAKFHMGPYEIEFALGIGCLAIVRRFPVARHPRAILAAGIAAFAAAAARTIYVGDLPPVTYGTTIPYGIAASGILVGAVWCERAGCLRIPRWAIFLGGASYSIYLLHYPLISVLLKLHDRLGVNGEGWAVPVFLALCLASVAAGCLYHVLIERRLIATSRRLLLNAVDTDRQAPEVRPALSKSSPCEPDSRRFDLPAKFVGGHLFNRIL
jgi:peptidoglycan/LPS O-acetylase OafA/YrhL